MTATTDRLILPQGTLLFAEGDVASVAYVIQSGTIEIFLPRSGGDLVLVQRGPGEIVGEMAIIDRGTRSASARVVEDCELCPITAAQFSSRIAKTDPILLMCLGVVIERYRETVAMLAPGTVIERKQPPAVKLKQHFTAALSTLSLESELRRAIATNELELYFQPIVRLPDRQLAGLEALMRWNHPERGLMSPAAFIPVAEACGLISDITAWCIAEVGRVFPSIIAAALTNPRAVDSLFMSVNISGHDLSHAAFMGELATMLAETGLSPGSIKLEITESVLMNEPLKAAAVLRNCRALGLTIAIDDFGTGYSSLSHLSTLPITTIKIDQSFVRSMIADPTSRKIIHMILRLAAELDIPVVAEGIEGESESQQLSHLGCALGQGYLFGRPQPLGTTLQAVRNWTTISGRPRGDLPYVKGNEALVVNSAA